MVSFDFRQPSILRRMFLAFLAFGLGMGLIFPIFANIFVEWKPHMLWWFVLACIAAGVSIGVFNYWLLNVMLLNRLKVLVKWPMPLVIMTFHRNVAWSVMTSSVIWR